jgi:hypothetical protein
MKFSEARFVFTEGDDSIIVTFAQDEVTVWRRGKVKRLTNKPAKWGGRPYKPRVTDALRAVGAIQPPKRIEPRPLAVVR